MIRHVVETDLALYAAGDLSLWQRGGVWFHVRGCRECRESLEAFRAGRERLLQAANDMPEEVNWDRLSSEMAANIRVGLAAGECVTPRERKPASLGWRPAAVAAGVTVLLAGAWWLNVPAGDTQKLLRSLQGIASGGRIAAVQEERGPVVGASSTGVVLLDNGSTLGMEQTGLQPVTFSVSAQGSASARYVDVDTGQMTITSVYVQ